MTSQLWGVIALFYGVIMCSLFDAFTVEVRSRSDVLFACLAAALWPVVMVLVFIDWVRR